MSAARGGVAPALGLYALAIVTLVGIAAAGADVTDLLDDPLAVGGVDRDRPWAGSLSIVGGMLWIAGATSCALAAALVTRHRGSAEDARFLWATAGLAAVIGADDLLLIHDAVVPVLVGRLGAELVVLAGLLALTLVWAARFHSHLVRHLGLVALTAGCFAVSVGLDAFASYDGDSVLAAAEDTAKLLGIATFAVLCVRWSWEAVPGGQGPAQPSVRGAEVARQ